MIKNIFILKLLKSKAAKLFIYIIVVNYEIANLLKIKINNC